MKLQVWKKGAKLRILREITVQKCFYFNHQSNGITMFSSFEERQLIQTHAGVSIMTFTDNESDDPFGYSSVGFITSIIR